LIRHSQFGKRLFDLALTSPALLLLSPLILLAAILTAIGMGRPIFFRQTRPGLLGQPFTLIKFRTMTQARDADGKLKPDPDRTPRMGRFLRRTSLDELPQLWNVVRGEMSLVGPRPLLMEYLPNYTPEQNRRHSVVPGITGWAQINGRNLTAFSERLKLDLWYVDHWSLWLDVKILARTVLNVICSNGVRLGQPLAEIDDIGLHPHTRRKGGSAVLDDRCPVPSKQLGEEAYSSIRVRNRL
jgi:sugar transferase EpsL